MLDYNFAHGEPLPANLSKLFQHILGRTLFHMGAYPRLHAARHRLLQGSRTPPRLPDVHPAHAYPLWHGGPRDVDSFSEWLDDLKMPRAFLDARPHYVDALNLEPSADIATVLVQLDKIDSEVVTALLELRPRRAFNLMRARNIWCHNHFNPNPYYDRCYLLKAIFGICVARWLRIEAMLCASKLRRPIGWYPLDHADRPDMVRYGPLYSRFMRELRKVKEVIKLYRSGANISHIVDDAEAGTLLQQVLGLPSWFKELGESEDRSYSQWNGLYRRAQNQQTVWQLRHGIDFKAILDNQIELIERKLTSFEVQAKLQKPTRSSFNKRVGNICFVDPLVRFYQLARFAVAWTDHSFSQNHDKPSTGTDALEQALNWLGTAPVDPYACPHPALQKIHSWRLTNVVAILRFAVISDDNVIPGSLRSERPTACKGQTENTVATSQFQVACAHGHVFSFNELYDAFQGNRENRCEIRKRANVRKNKSLSDFKTPMRKVVRHSLAILACRLTDP